MNDALFIRAHLCVASDVGIEATKRHCQCAMDNFARLVREEVVVVEDNDVVETTVVSLLAPKLSVHHQSTNQNEEP